VPQAPKFLGPLVNIFCECRGPLGLGWRAVWHAGNRKL